MAHFQCGYCQHQESLGDECLGRWARCPDCQQVSRVTVGDNLTAAGSLSILQSLTTGWRGIAILVGSGILSFCAVAAWVNQPASDWSNEVKESVTSKPGPPAADQRGQAGPDFVAKVMVQTSEASQSNPPADALFAIDNAASVPVSVQPIVVVPANTPVAEHDLQIEEPSSRLVRDVADASPAINRDLDVDKAEEAVPPAKPIAVAKAADPKHAVSASHASAVASSKAAHEEHVQHLGSAAEGRELFEHVWTAHDPLAGKGDGLGPVFNGRSCVECHFQGGLGGAGSNKHNVHNFELLPDQPGGPLLNGVIHASATETGLLETEKDLKALFGFPKVPFRTIDPNPKKVRTIAIDAVRTVALNTPALWGNGLIDKISTRELQKLEFTHPSTGRFHQLTDGRIGKFGWKAQTASLHQFVGSACAAELGLSNSVRSQQKPLKFRDDSLAGHDLNDDQVRSLTRFVAELPLPRQVLPESEEGRKEVVAGERIFNTIGCVKCHVRDVGVAHGVYSDFRLHNISSGLTKSETYYVFDAVPINVPEANAPKLSEWKTPPLWGLADTAPYWHDGSAHTIRDAILKHDGEGNVVKTEFEVMTTEQQNRLLAFLETLRAPAPDPASATH